MKAMSIFFRLILFISLVLQISSCTEYYKDEPIDTSSESTGEAMFWIASDLGVGNIAVTCNKSTKIIDNYFSEGTPSCGTSGCASFTLMPGKYSYTATGGSWNWNGTIEVNEGSCSKMKFIK